jgi:hypothetical protein
MWEVVILLIAAMFGYLANKFLDQRQAEIDKKSAINSKASEDALAASLEEMRKTLDQRINKAFENHAFIKQEFDSLKLAVGLKGNR